MCFALFVQVLLVAVNKILEELAQFDFEKYKLENRAVIFPTRHRKRLYKKKKTRSYFFNASP